MRRERHFNGFSTVWECEMSVIDESLFLLYMKVPQAGRGDMDSCLFISPGKESTCGFGMGLAKVPDAILCCCESRITWDKFSTI